MIGVAKHPAEMLGVFSAVYTNGEGMWFFSLKEGALVTQ